MHFAKILKISSIVMLLTGALSWQRSSIKEIDEDFSDHSQRAVVAPPIIKNLHENSLRSVPPGSPLRYLKKIVPNTQLLIAEHKGSTAYFMADYILITTSSKCATTLALSDLASNGFNAWQPYSFSNQIFVETNASTPEELDLSLQQSLAAITSTEAQAYLDGVSLNAALSSPSRLIPNDSAFDKQWYLEKIKCPEAWAITRGSHSVRVAIIDGGLFPHYTEFEDRIENGYNFYDDYVSTAYDPSGHGTIVTGILAATGNNKIHGAGIDWNCSIMPLKVYGETIWGIGKPTLESAFSAAVDHAIANNANVVNISLGPAVNNLTLKKINDAIEAGMIIIIASGNDGTIRFNDIATLPGVIAVGASDKNDQRVELSSTDRELDLVAPGTEIRVWSDVNQSYTSSGTSLSAPQVAGAAALLKSIRPDLSAEAIKMCLLAGTDDIGEPGWDEETGWGRLNVLNSLMLARCKTRLEETNNGKPKLIWEKPPISNKRIRYNIFRSYDLKDWVQVTEPSIDYGEMEASWIDSIADPTTSRSHFYRVELENQIDLTPTVINVFAPEATIPHEIWRTDRPYEFTPKADDLTTFINDRKTATVQNLPSIADYYLCKFAPEQFPYRIRYEPGESRHWLHELGYPISVLAEGLTEWGSLYNTFNGPWQVWPNESESANLSEEYIAALTEQYGDRFIIKRYQCRESDIIFIPDVDIIVNNPPRAGSLITVNEDEFYFIAYLPDELHEILSNCDLLEEVLPLPTDFPYFPHQ